MRTARPRHAMLGLIVLALSGGAGTAVAQQGPPTGDSASTATSTLKSMVSLQGASALQLTGYGLVVGLDRTGDRARAQSGAVFTVQSIANMLREFGVNVDQEVLQSRNVAAVLVTAALDPFAGTGSEIDVTVSSLGDARSLSGGVLLRTPLQDPDKVLRAVAQGPLTTGAAQASSQGSEVKVNSPNTGRVPNGAIVRRAHPVDLDPEGVGLVLRRPDFTNASKIADAINEVFPDAAEAAHAGLVNVGMPEALNNPSQLMAALEGVEVEVKAPARVVINERTGTIVAGGNVTINEVMVTKGGITVSTQEDRFVSQPNPLGEGETQPVAEGEAEVQQEGARSVVLPPNTNVSELASALNDLGITARDIISIFQSIDRAGALQAELVIL
ncbi:flagellar basal body P-ring protein FlgI [Salinibacter altiplanensis]|uniref:flagellar basal body P-ring protein FlgI n=1 Tax=Salinibacter altiplanensis TaxID=1803181 RepID=UPI000C9FB1F3|nr:flagellar basal body P-ring protein FlgI [Salinibacter altiplanensis]